MTSIVLITGASGGIGRALARQLHAQGCHVAVVARDVSRLADVEATVRISADTTTPEGAALAVAACQEALGAPPALLAHCVGSTLLAPLHRTRVEAYREVMRVNLDSAVFMLQAWITALQGGSGAAVLASSVVARIGVANHEAIAAAKGGVEAHDGWHAEDARNARGRCPAVSARRGADGGSGGRGDGLAARRWRRAPDRPSDRGRRWLHHCAAIGEMRRGVQHD